MPADHASALLPVTTDEHLQNIARLADEAGFITYARYLGLREQGHREDAFAALNEQIRLLLDTGFDERLHFVRWLLDLTQNSPLNLLRPYPLEKQVIEPTLREWVAREPTLAEPRYWLGGVADLRKALELDPTFEPARWKLARWLLGWVSMGSHEMPRGFIGDPQEGLAALDELEALCRDLPDSEEKQHLERRARVEREVLTNYMEYLKHYRQTGEAGFEHWATARGRRCVS